MCLVSVSIPEWWVPHGSLSRLYLSSGNKSILDAVRCLGSLSMREGRWWRCEGARELGN
jgi:hypothetical protein